MTGEELRNKRIEFGLSQKELSELLGISRNTVSNYERDSVIPASRLVIINAVFERLESENNTSEIAEDTSTAYNLKDETIPKEFLNEILNKFHPIEIINYIYDHLDQYMAQKEFVRLAKSVVNEHEISKMKASIEELKAKVEELNTSK